MANASPIRSGVGFRNLTVFELDSDGTITASSTSAYSGVQVSGVKSLTINAPSPRQIAHTGDDRVFAIDFLPASDVLTAELRTGKVNDTADAIFTNTNSALVGESRFFGVTTNKSGDEAQVCLLAYRQSLDTNPDSSTYGKRHWEARLFPVATVIPQENSFDENPEERTYTVIPQICTQFPWGVAFTESENGFTEAQMLRVVCEGKPHIDAFLGDGVVVEFTLSNTACSTDKVRVFHNGSDVTSSVTVTTTSVTFTVAPADGDKIIVWYEV